MITIRDIHGNGIVSVVPSNGSKRVYTLMREDYVQLRFSLAQAMQLPLGCYIVTEQYGRFELVDRTYPKLNNKTGGWDYDIRFEAVYMKWRNKLFKYEPQSGNNEVSWSLTAPLNVHMQLFMRNLESLGYKHNGTAYSCTIDDSVTDDAKQLTYDSRNLWDALLDMASAFECEVWVADSVIRFGRCESGEPIEFRQGVNVEQMTAEGTRAQYATRLYAFGSTRNIPKTYRPTTTDVAVNGVVQKRLMMPSDTPYIDSEPNLDITQAVEQVVVFDDVYPRTQSTISNVTTVQYDEQNEQGEPNGNHWNAYRFKIPSLQFKEEYILEDTPLQAIFQSGHLGGMTFDVRFNPEGLDETNPNAQVFEIIRNEEYGRPIPDNTLYPSSGDKVVLIGWDSARIESLGLIAAAEQELKQKALQKAAKMRIDPANYRCTMISAAMFDRGGLWTPYDVGFRVRLYNEGCFEDGNRLSRIIGYEYDFSQPFKTPTYVVGEQAAITRLGEIEGKVDALTIAGQTFTGEGGGNGGSNVYVLKTNDTTAPSDSNVMSALRSKREFLSRINNDTALGRIDFVAGLQSDGVAQFLNTAEFGEFLSGMHLGYGGAVDNHGNAEFQTLKVRSGAEFMELIINRATARDADELLTDSGTIESVEEITPMGENGQGRYILHLRRRFDGDFTSLTEGAVIRGIMNNIYKAAVANTSASYYTSWMRVNAVTIENNTIEVVTYRHDKVEGGRNFPPCELMNVGRWGHETDKTRQSTILFSATERRIVFYQNVDKPIIDPKTCVGMCLGKAPEFLKANNQIDDNQNYLYVKGVFAAGIYHVDINGEPLYEYVVRGFWESGVRYFYKTKNPDTDKWEISLVYHNGCQWQCMADGTEEEPSALSTDWAMTEGDNRFRIEFAEPYEVFELSSFDTTLTIVAYLGNEEVTDAIQDANVGWSRYTEDAQGNQRTASDTIWIQEHSNSGKQIHLLTADLGMDSAGLPKKIIFTATARLSEGVSAKAQYMI